MTKIKIKEGQTITRDEFDDYYLPDGNYVFTDRSSGETIAGIASAKDGKFYTAEQYSTGSLAFGDIFRPDSSGVYESVLKYCADSITLIAERKPKLPEGAKEINEENLSEADTGIYFFWMKDYGIALCSRDYSGGRWYASSSRMCEGRRYPNNVPLSLPVEGWFRLATKKDIEEIKNYGQEI